jgi:hypothetical protein
MKLPWFIQTEPATHSISEAHSIKIYIVPVICLCLSLPSHCEPPKGQDSWLIHTLCKQVSSKLLGNGHLFDFIPSARNEGHFYCPGLIGN